MKKKKLDYGKDVRINMPFKKVIRRHWLLLVMLLPAICYVILFSYIPMTGIILAFEKYTYAGGLYGSRKVGFQNFRALFISGKLGLIIKNTLLYNAIFISTGLVFEVGFAVLLNAMIGKRYKKFCQACMFLPHFISWVVAGAIMYNVFNYEKGVLNHLIRALGGEGVDIYNNPPVWLFIFPMLKLWKSTGYGTVVYLAAITGLDQEMFEAASIDGASAWQKIRYITIPSLIPTMCIMLLLAIGNIFRGDFGLFYQTVKSTSLLQPYTEIIDTYIFKLLITSNDVGVSAATSLFQSILCFITINLANFTVKKINPDYSLY